MQVTMKKKWRHWALCAVLAVGSALAALSLGDIRFFHILNLKAYDAHFIVRDFLRGRPAISNIVLLTADKKAMDTFPELRVFWNEHYANAIRAAGQAGAISTSPVPVVVGYVSELNSNRQSQSIPVNMMAAALGLGAFANLTSDDDDFIRNQELMEAPSANPADPPPARSLAMRTVEKYIGTDAQFQKGSLLLQGQAIPISPGRSVAINFAGPPNTFPSVSLADFEAAAKA